MREKLLFGEELVNPGANDGNEAETNKTTNSAGSVNTATAAFCNARNHEQRANHLASAGNFQTFSHSSSDLGCDARNVAHETKNTRSGTATTKASKGKRLNKSAIPALMPLRDGSDKTFWPIAALNNDAKSMAIEALREQTLKRHPSPSTYTTEMALAHALASAKHARNESFKYCLDDGVLLLTWRGSQALLQTLPSSLRGAQ